MIQIRAFKPGLAADLTNPAAPQGHFCAFSEATPLRTEPPTRWFHLTHTRFLNGFHHFNHLLLDNRQVFFFLARWKNLSCWNQKHQKRIPVRRLSGLILSDGLVVFWYRRVIYIINKATRWLYGGFHNCRLSPSLLNLSGLLRSDWWGAGSHGPNGDHPRLSISIFKEVLCG